MEISQTPDAWSPETAVLFMRDTHDTHAIGKVNARSNGVVYEVTVFAPDEETLTDVVDTLERHGYDANDPDVLDSGNTMLKATASTVEE